MALKKSARKDAVEQRRDSIVRAARGVFARQGYAETVVDDIAEQAGIAKGTLYLYFRSKEEIYMAALLEDARRLNDQTAERIRHVESWQEKLRAYVQLRMEYLETNQDFLRIYLTEIRAMMLRDARIHCELHQVLSEGEKQLVAVLATAIARNEIRHLNAELAALTVLDLTRGLMERRLLKVACASTGAVDAEFTLQFLFRALAREPDDPQNSQHLVLERTTEPL